MIFFAWTKPNSGKHMFRDLWEHQNMKIEILKKIQINIRATCVLFQNCIVFEVEDFYMRNRQQS